MYKKYAGYETEEEAFLARVEKDATSFHPFGNCIHSYSRPALSTSSGTNNVEYEVYHVSPKCTRICRRD